MSDREQRDIQRDILQSIQEEDYAQQKQQVIVSSHHVLGAEVRERQQQHTAGLLDEAFIARRNTVCKHFAGENTECR